MKPNLFLISVITVFILASCNKEKQFEKMLYGEWEVTSFMHGANDLTQFYKDSCGCRLVFIEYKLNGDKFKKCILKCNYNNWNYYNSDSLEYLPWKTHIFQHSNFELKNDFKEIKWFFGNQQPTQIYRWGMYPLCRTKGNIETNFNTFYIIDEISNNEFTMQYTDSTNIPYFITIKKM